MEEKRIKTINMLTLAFGIAFMPPVWAVLAPFIGVDTGAVALICAGLFVATAIDGRIRLRSALVSCWAIYGR